MDTVTGLVMQVNRKTIIVLTQQGEFKEVPLPEKIPQVGEQITICERPRWLWAVAAMIAVAIIGSTLGTWVLMPRPVACLALDVNPSMELYIGLKEQVIKVHLLNEDATKVVKGLPLKGTNVYESLEIIIDRTVALGYVDTKGNNLIATALVPVSKDRLILEKERVEGVIIDELHKKGISAELGVNIVTPEVMRQAKSEKLSINKYLAVSSAKNKGIKIDTKEIQRKSIREIVQSSGLTFEDVFCEIRNQRDTQKPQIKIQKEVSKDKTTIRQGEDKNQFLGAFFKQKQTGKVSLQQLKQRKKEQRNDKFSQQPPKQNVKEQKLPVKGDNTPIIKISKEKKQKEGDEHRKKSSKKQKDVQKSG